MRYILAYAYLCLFLLTIFGLWQSIFGTSEKISETSKNVEFIHFLEIGFTGCSISSSIKCCIFGNLDRMVKGENGF